MRRLYVGLAIVSLLSGLALCGLWAGSYFEQETFGGTLGDELTFSISVRGNLVVAQVHEWPIVEDWILTRRLRPEPVDVATWTGMSIESHRVRWGFEHVRGKWVSSQVLVDKTTRFTSPEAVLPLDISYWLHRPIDIYVIPYWFLAALPLLGVLPLYLSMRSQRRASETTRSTPVTMQVPATE